MFKKINFKKSVYICCFFSMGIFAQEKITTESFDEIFKEWMDPSKPGVAAGVIHNGKVIYLKGFGSAEIEHNTKITPQTRFQVDDLAKQFTVLAILLLEQEDKLSLEDDIRKYLPELPDYKTPIKVKHLLNHSSGLNNLDPVKELLGIRRNDVFTQQDALMLIRSQKQLNFTPGTDFSYHQSDTELILLAEIVAKASNQTFPEYASKYIFKPLQMNNTVFNNERNLLENTATSYNVGEQIRHNPVNDLTLGVTNLYTSAEDLTKWYISFTNPVNKLGELVRKLDTYVTLNNGKMFTSSWGRMTYGRYFDHAERGVPKIWQYGLVGGYASNIFRFHTKNFTSFVIGNNNRYNGMPAMQMAYKILENDFKEPPSIDFSKIKIKKISVKKLKKYEGFFWNKKNGLARHIYVNNDTLRYKRLESNRETALIPINENIFQFVVGSDDKIILKFIDNKFSVVSGESDASIYNKYQPVTTVNNELNNYTGLFYNKELDVTYTFSVENDMLVAKNLKNGTTQFHQIIKDIFRSNTFMLSGIEFARNNQNKIIGFGINTDGVKNLKFEKIFLKNI